MPPDGGHSRKTRPSAARLDPRAEAVPAFLLPLSEAGRETAERLAAAALLGLALFLLVENLNR